MNLLKKIIFLLIIIVASVCGDMVAAQEILPQLKRESPDIEQIRREVNDRNGQYYYPRLMREFERNDTLMKIDKFRRLYLGYMLQEDYDPYRQTPGIPDLSSLIVTGKKTSRTDCDSIIKYSRQALADNPLDLKHIAFLIQALRDKGDINLAKIWQYKLNYLLMAIVSTGSGTDEADAWWVVEPQHEYVLLNMMGFTVVRHDYGEPGYERIIARDKQGQHNEFYFNIATMLEEYYRKHPDEIDPNASETDTYDP